MKVSIDGKVVNTQLDGVAISLDPGTHRVRLEAVSGAFYDRQVVIKEGEQKRLIAVVLAKPAEEVPPDAAPKPVETPPDTPPDEAPPVSHGSGLRVAGFVVGGVGLGGLVLGTVFGVLAIGSKDQAACTPDGYCAPGPLADARSQATVATVGLVSGGVLLATGITLILVAPKSAPTESALRLELSPVLGGSYAGLLAGGRW